MRKGITLSAAFFIAFIICIGCSAGSSTIIPTSGFRIDSLADDMRACAPDLASSVITVWEDGSNGWSSNAEYGVLKKHFDSSSGTESIYATVLMLDEMTDQLAQVPESFFEEDGSTTHGDYTITNTTDPGNFTLPTIIGGDTITDFEIHLNSTATGYSSDLYYKEPSDSDNVERIFYRYNNTTDSERGLVYATRNSSTEEISVYTACHKAPGDAYDEGPSAPFDENEFRCLLYFEGNLDTETFAFKVKTDAGGELGWAFFGGGSVSSDDDYIAVRGTVTADDLSTPYENDGNLFTDDSENSTYVIITFGDMTDSSYDPGDSIVKYGTYTNLDAETAYAVDYIDLTETECLYSTVTEFQNFKYPDTYGQLGFTE